MAEIEIWLKVNNESFRLPVLPPSIEVGSSNNHQRVQIHELGEVLLLGNANLKDVSINTFFPGQVYPFVEYNNIMDPNETAEMIDKWKENKEVVQLTITGTNIRMDVAIDYFSWQQPDGAGDVYYKLDLVEYPQLRVRTKASKRYAKPKAKRPAKKVTQKSHTVKRGDTLWAISKRYTGNPMNYKRIAKANGIKNPNLIFPGQVIKI